MSQETPAVEEVIEPAATQQKEVETTIVETTTTEPASVQETNDNRIDHAAELERLTKERDNYKQGLLNTKDELKKVKAEPEETFETTEVDIDKVVEEKMNARMRDFVSDSTDAIAESLSSNPDEQALMMHYYENKIQKSGFDRKSITEDLRLALGMANTNRIVKENSELKRTAQVKQTIVNATPGSNQDKYVPGSESAPKFTAAEQEYMKRYDLKPEDIKIN